MEARNLRNRLIIILYILSFTASIFIFAFIMNRVSVDVELTDHNQYAVSGSNIYYIQNHRKEGFLFSMNTAGRVLDMFSSRSLGDNRILSVSVNGDKIYIVLQTFIEQQDEKDPDAIVSIPAYRVACLDSRLRLVSSSPKFRIDDTDILKGFSAEATGLFMTFVTNDGNAVKVYSMAPTDLRDPSEEAAKAVQLEGVRTRKSEDGRFYADALYSFGQLYVRTDKSAPEGIFVIDPMVNVIISKMKLGIGKIINIYFRYIIWYIAALLIWFVLLFLLIRVIVERNRSFYYLMIAETLLVVILGGATLTIFEEHQRAREVEHSRFAVTSLIGLMEDAGLNETVDYTEDTFYDTVRYKKIANALTEFVSRDGNSDIFYNVFVLRLSDNMVCASSSGRNKETVTDIYSGDAADIAVQIARGNRYVGVDIQVEGQNYRAVAVADAPVSADYALVGIINIVSTDASVFVDNLGVFVLFLLVFAVASAMVVLVWYLHLRDLATLEQAMSDTALGKELPERPAIIGRDIKDMWDSLAEVNKRVEEIQYSKVRILEAYYRFAPKNVEKLLGRESILEVKSGDYKVINGTLGTFTISGVDGNSRKRLDSMVSVIGAYQREHESVIIGKAPDVSAIQLLFSENEKNVAETFVEAFASSNKGTEAADFTVLLNYEKCIFGVTGSEEETTTFMYTENRDTIRKMSAFVNSVGLKLVISERVLDRDNISSKVRFIGYGGVGEDGELIGLYEVLDACPARIRAERIATLAKFNEAMDLFYEKDFYLARTRFSEILKEAPDDHLVKWYVFESDRYLNESAEGDSFKILHV